MAMNILILGSRGFIGSALAKKLNNNGIICSCLEPEQFLKADKFYDVIVYAIGLTSDFRKDLKKTFEAHVLVLEKIADSNKCGHLIYLSSTHLYKTSTRGDECTTVNLNPLSREDFYSITKLMGEMYCLHTLNYAHTIVRLSNVIGPDIYSTNFLTSIVYDAVKFGRIELQSNPNDTRDFILLDDVTNIIMQIIIQKPVGIINAASGEQLKLGKIAEMVAHMTNSTLKINNTTKSVYFPKFDIQTLKTVLDYTPQKVMPQLPQTIKEISDAYK